MKILEPQERAIILEDHFDVKVSVSSGMWPGVFVDCESEAASCGGLSDFHMVLCVEVKIENKTAYFVMDVCPQDIWANVCIHDVDRVTLSQSFPYKIPSHLEIEAQLVQIKNDHQQWLQYVFS